MLIFLEKGMILLVSLIFFNITSQPTGIWNKNLQQFNHSLTKQRFYIREFCRFDGSAERRFL